VKALFRGSIALVALVAACSPPAKAADIAVPYKAPPLVTTGGVYVWADGSYQSVSLPTFDLGLKRVSLPNFPDVGPLHSFNPRATGYGIAGGIGYVSPNGTFASSFGSNVRVELDFSYVHANDSQSAVSPTHSFFPSLVSGIIFEPISFLPLPPSAISNLTTDYTAWQASLKAASDYKYRAFTLSPSVALFGGNTRNNQGLSQVISGFTEAYQSNSSLHWVDAGVKLGLDGKIDFATWLTVAVGGNVGVAYRDVSLAASDTVFLGGGPGINSAISATATTVPLLANAEASVTVRPWTLAAIKVFAGLNYDSRVPGISAPTFSGIPFAPPPAVHFVQGTPAGIKYEGETSYYAGGGVTVKFGGPVVAKN